MITTTKQEIRKAVIEALEEKTKKRRVERSGRVVSHKVNSINKSDYPSVADLVAETLGEPQKPQKPQWTLESPCHWAESVKMAKSLHIKLECYNEKYYYDDSSLSYCGDPLVDRTCGPFTLPELHDKLISLRESEGE